MVVFHSYVNVYQRVIFPVLGIPWYTHFKDSYCGMTMAHMLPSQPAHLPNIYEWMALSETGIPRSLMMNHHFPIIFPSFSLWTWQILWVYPQFFFQNPSRRVVPWSLGELGPAVRKPGIWISATVGCRGRLNQLTLLPSCRRRSPGRPVTKEDGQLLIWWSDETVSYW